MAESGQKATSPLIKINIPAKEMRVYSGKELVFEFPIAVGANEFKTPSQATFIKQITWNPWWNPPPDSKWAKDDKPTPPGPNNPLGPVKMELDGMIRMHGTSNEGSIGNAASHGCIRMYNDDAKALAWWVQSNFSSKDDPDLLNEYSTHRTESYPVSLNRKVSVLIEYAPFEISGDSLVFYPDIYATQSGARVSSAVSYLHSLGFKDKEIKRDALENYINSSDDKTVSVNVMDVIDSPETDFMYELAD